MAGLDPALPAYVLSQGLAWLDGSAPPPALLLAALLADAAWRGFAWVRAPHPVAWLGLLIGWLDRTLNRPHRTEQTRRWLGVGAVAFTTGLATGAGQGLDNLLERLPGLWGGLVEAAVITVLLAGRSLFTHVRAVARALEQGDPETDGLRAGRRAAARIAGRDPEQLDRCGVARTALESLAENFSDAVVAPAFWYLLAGLPGLFCYKAINTLDSMIGYRNPRYRAFGWAAARLDDAVNWVPARLSGALLTLAASLTPGMNGRRALRVMLRDSGRHASPNAGWPEAALAGALGVALGGLRSYPGGVVERAWIGGCGRADATSADIGAGLRLYVAANVMLAAVLAVVLGLWIGA